jgi:hypothetical protein
VTGETDQLTQGVVTALTDLTSRIDSRLADTQTTVEGLQSEIAALQARIQTLQSRLLMVYNLIALAATLLFLWVIYSQIVVIRHHWSRSSRVTLTPGAPEQGAATVSGKTDPETPLEIDEGDMAPQTVEAVGETLSAEAMPDQPAESTDSKA